MSKKTGIVTQGRPQKNMRVPLGQVDTRLNSSVYARQNVKSPILNARVRTGVRHGMSREQFNWLVGQ